MSERQTPYTVQSTTTAEYTERVRRHAARIPTIPISVTFLEQCAHSLKEVVEVEGDGLGDVSRAVLVAMAKAFEGELARGGETGGDSGQTG